MASLRHLLLAAVALLACGARATQIPLQLNILLRSGDVPSKGSTPFGQLLTWDGKPIYTEQPSVRVPCSCSRHLHWRRAARARSRASASPLQRAAPMPAAGVPSWQNRTGAASRLPSLLAAPRPLQGKPTSDAAPALEPTQELDISANPDFQGLLQARAPPSCSAFAILLLQTV